MSEKSLTLLQVNIQDTTSLPPLTRGDHATSCPVYYCNYSAKSRVAHDCHSKHPPKSTSCIKGTIPSSRMKNHHHDLHKFTTSHSTQISLFTPCYIFLFFSFLVLFFKTKLDKIQSPLKPKIST